MDPGARPAQPNPDVAAFVAGLLDNAAQLRLPELFLDEHPDAIYRVRNRNGVSVIVLRTSALTEDQLSKLMKYRLAQYLATNFVDPGMIYDARLEHEPLSGVSPHDIHLIAGAAETNEILCYAVFEAPPEAPPGTILRMRDRPLFPVEKVHGWGIFNRLRLLPDLPIAKLRELGRFVKNQRLRTLDELGVRAPVEIGVAVARTLSGPLRLEVDAIIGDLEEGIGKQNLEFFRIPLVVIHGTVPYEAEASYFFPRYQFCTVYPFASLSSDISPAMLTRTEQAEQALALPGKAALVALLRLKRDVQVGKSSLESPEGLTPLTAAEVPQQSVAMQTRRQMIDVGQRLHAMDLFQELSVAEATVLGTFMERREVAAGELVVRRGEVGDALFIIESGQAEVRRGGLAGDAVAAVLEPGEYFGEVALVTGAERIADVVAVTPMVLMRLGKDDYERYLVHTTEVEQHLQRTAMRRVARGVAPAADVATSDVFAGLTAADASVLGSFMERKQVDAGTVIVHRGEPGDALFLVESGQAEARAPGPDGRLMVFGSFGPGQYFGEVALATDAERIADVVALTPMSLVRLSREGYERYLRQVPEWGGDVARTAATRAAEHLRKLTSGTQEPAP